jgi:DNA-binding NarL/FixJ family response regulator
MGPPDPYQPRHSGKGPTERRLETIRVFELLLEGWKVPWIARELGISKRTVYRRTEDALRRTPLPEDREIMK